MCYRKPEISFFQDSTTEVAEKPEEPAQTGPGEEDGEEVEELEEWLDDFLED